MVVAVVRWSQGAVSVSLDGDEVAISLARALNMDMTHQVAAQHCLRNACSHRHTPHVAPCAASSCLLVALLAPRLACLQLPCDVLQSHPDLPTPDAHPALIIPRKGASRSSLCLTCWGNDAFLTKLRPLALPYLALQVVGRVHKGLEILDAISDMQVTHEDLPLNKVVVAKSGATNAKGSHEELDECECHSDGLRPVTCGGQRPV